LDSPKSIGVRLSEAARNFEARTADWPVWRRLVVFVPVFLVLAWLLAAAIVGATSLLHHL